MPTDSAFRLSAYLTLGLSCLCLGYAEWDLLREAVVFTAVALVLLAASYRAEGRYELDLKTANRLGLAIGLAAAGWLAYQFLNRKSLIYTLPWPASLFPYIGLILMVLMPAKMARPKHVGDWWFVQGIALVGAVLASSMAEDEVFGVLLGLYAAAAVSTLALFFARRSAGALPPVPHTDPGPTPVLAAAGDPTRGGRAGRTIPVRAVGWLLLAAAVGAPLFFLTPRSQAPTWEFGTTREVGYSNEQMIDLTRAGDLRVNREVAFQVKARYPDGRPKEDLNPDQRWRGTAFNQYDGGRWTRKDGGVLLAADTRVGAVGEGQRYIPPDLGPGQFVLDFGPRGRPSDSVLADPVSWDVGKPPPVCTLLGDQTRSWLQAPDGSFRPIGLAPGTQLPYRQVSRPVAPGTPPEDADLSPPFELAAPPREPGAPAPPVVINLNDPIPTYKTVRLPRLGTWTHDLLTRLATRDARVRTALARADTRKSLEIAPRDHEAVARALADYLANSGEYKYTLKLRRLDLSADPVEEFLYRTKEGHCQRFAAALALMLRSVGVPANYVLGFKGCEYEGDGVYTIRQDHAHAWVEVLISRPAPPRRGDGGRQELVWHWLSLDPSPLGGDAEEADGSGNWLAAVRQTGAEFFQNFIVGYNRDRRDRAVQSAGRWLTRGGWAVAGVLPVAAAGLIVRSARRARRRRNGTGTPTTGYDWFDRLERLLADAGYPVAPGATPREHAAVVSAALAASPTTAAVADVPPAVTRAFYLARFAAAPPTDAEAARLSADLDRLQRSLRSAPPRGDTP